MWNDANTWVAIGTGMMALATFFTLLQNRRQLKELKLQWQDSNRPKLVFSIENRGFCILSVRNVGNQRADNINYSFNKDFLDMLPFDIKERLVKPASSNMYIIPGQEKLFLLTKDVCETDVLMDMPIQIKGRYNNFEINENFTIRNFCPGAITINVKKKEPIQILHEDLSLLNKTIERLFDKK